MSYNESDEFAHSDKDEDERYVSVDGKAWVRFNLEPECSHIEQIKEHLQSEQFEITWPQVFGAGRATKEDLERDGFGFDVLDCSAKR